MKEEKFFSLFEELSNHNIINLFSKRPLNFNMKKVNKEVINNQYEMIQKELGYKFIKIINPIQTHTNIVKKVDLNNIDDDFNNVDGLITNLQGIALVTFLADCQGILLYDHKKNVIGNIHSGWKGTLNRIIISAIELMEREYNSLPEDIMVYFCPSILKCCFEVDEDVKDEFVKSFTDIEIEKYITSGEIKDNKQKYFIDTFGINVNLIKSIGILENNIYNSNICTKCNSDTYFSYRGCKEIDGRNIALIAIK